MDDVSDTSHSKNSSLPNILLLPNCPLVSSYGTTWFYSDQLNLTDLPEIMPDINFFLKDMSCPKSVWDLMPLCLWMTD